jgi:DNA-binding NtrC family response regulator
MAIRVLVVDDDPDFSESMLEALNLMGFKPTGAASVDEAKKRLDKAVPDIILCDLNLGKQSGMDLLRDLKKTRPDLPIILMTGFADLETAVEALREGAADFLQKPINYEAIKITIERVLESSRLKQRMDVAGKKRKAKYSFDSVVCESAAMKQVVKTARKIAASPVGTVLILGESGAGKDHLARAIHYESPRAAHPFMEVSCTAIPGDLLESELFGHEKGAFTSAVSSKKGILELAQGGTAFLNEIGHMPLSLQAKVLRVLEDKTFMRVGGKEEITIDVRIMAATNENLQKAMAEGRFRGDLFFRLNVLTLNLSPLRDRREDILPLADIILEKLCDTLRRPKPELSEEFRQVLLAHDWPGNVRELRNTLERMLILGEEEPLSALKASVPAVGARRIAVEGGTTTIEMAPPASVPAGGAVPAAAAPAGNGDPFVLPQAGVKLEEVEKRLIAQALERTGGNQRDAAKLLGLSRFAFSRRAEKYGLKVKKS